MKQSRAPPMPRNSESENTNLTLAAKTVNRICIKGTLTVKTVIRPTWGRSRRTQTGRTVKNNGCNYEIRGIVHLVFTGSKDLIKQFSNTWSI